MNPSEPARFDTLYAKHLRALRLQGKAWKATDSYARAVRRASDIDTARGRVHVPRGKGCKGRFKAERGQCAVLHTHSRRSTRPGSFNRG